MELGLQRPLLPLIVVWQCPFVVGTSLVEALPVGVGAVESVEDGALGSAALGICITSTIRIWIAVVVTIRALRSQRGIRDRVVLAPIGVVQRSLHTVQSYA